MFVRSIVDKKELIFNILEKRHVKLITLILRLHYLKLRGQSVENNIVQCGYIYDLD
jgi:hypothetical protein